MAPQTSVVAHQSVPASGSSRVALEMSSLGKSVVAGGLASTIAKTLVAPGERVRIIIQTRGLFNHYHPQFGANSANTLIAPQRPRVLQIVTDIAKSGGLPAFWRGNLTNCLRAFPSTALRFSLFARLRAATPIEFRESFGGALALGAISGGTTTLATFPLDLVRTKLAVDGTHTPFDSNKAVASNSSSSSSTTRAPRYRGMWHCASETVRTGGGIAALYRGLSISVIEIMPYTAISIGGFDLCKTHVLPVLVGGGRGDGVVVDNHRAAKLDNGQHLSVKLLVGWAVGLIASLTCYPLDTVKRHIMLQSDAACSASRGNRIAEDFARRGMLSQIHQTGWRIWNAQGFAGFYRGVVVNAMKSAPAAAVTLVANDKLRSLLGLH